MHPPSTLAIAILTALVSVAAFYNPSLKERLLFVPEKILIFREWHRMLSSALIHSGWLHLGFNLYGLLSFGRAIELIHGPLALSLVYTASILGGSALSLFIHRNDAYAALGASGGVCGVIFSAIFLNPGSSVGLLFLPIQIPGTIFAMLFLIGTYLALRKAAGNIAHDAHFGGAIAGLLFTAVYSPGACIAEPWIYGFCLVFSAVCLWHVTRNSNGGDLADFKTGQYRPNVRYQRYDEAAEKRRRAEEIDRILDKVAEKGMGSLSRRERERLKELSETVR